MLMHMLRVFSLAYAYACAYALVKTSKQDNIPKVWTQYDGLIDAKELENSLYSVLDHA